MTVWKPTGRRAYRYRFFLRGERFEGNTACRTLADAKEAEAQLIRQAERQRAGLLPLAEHAPRFSDWAAVYLRHVRERGHVRRVERLEELLRVVLRFWGARPSGLHPKNPPIEGEPYRDLRLTDPIRQPQLIVEFEQWMAARIVKATGRPLSNQTKNHYRSILSRLYRVAALPRYSAQTGVGKNPFAGLERDPTRPRCVTVSPGELRTWLAHTSRHAQLAIAIAALAPKLRLANVLSLEWDRHFDPALSYLTVPEHKTVGETGRPLVVPITPPLRAILKAARAARRGPFVIMHRGHRVRSIRHAIRTGAQRAGLTYGRDVGGVTFHTIRHTAATLLAGMPSITEALRASTMGHGDIATTQAYTHLKPASERPVLARLARTLKLDAVMRAAGPAVPSKQPVRKPPQTRGISRRRRGA